MRDCTYRHPYQYHHHHHHHHHQCRNHPSSKTEPARKEAHTRDLNRCSTFSTSNHLPGSLVIISWLRTHPCACNTTATRPRICANTSRTVLLRQACSGHKLKRTPPGKTSRPCHPLSTQRSRTALCSRRTAATSHRAGRPSQSKSQRQGSLFACANVKYARCCSRTPSHCLADAVSVDDAYPRPTNEPTYHTPLGLNDC